MNNQADLLIGNRPVGEGKQTFIVAELSANHCHNLDLTLKTVEAMKKAGADAVKVQTLTADSMTIACDNDYFKIKSGTPWDGKTLYQLYSETPLPWEWHESIERAAAALDMAFFSTPYDKAAVDFLEKMNVPAYKISSFEINDIPFVKYVASKGRPVILSTGLATLADIDDAVKTCRQEGNDKICLLKCTSAYPAPIEDANLKTMTNMAETFRVTVGLSDHTDGYSVAAAAVALGARIVEKHFTLDRKFGGPDASFSVEPEEFSLMVRNIREVEKCLGDVSYELSASSAKNAIFSRSIFVIADVRKGEKLCHENVRSIRPGYGLHPKYLPEIIGKTARRDINRGEPLTWSMIE